jgi:hypothetical protein
MKAMRDASMPDRPPLQLGYLSCTTRNDELRDRFLLRFFRFAFTCTVASVVVPAFGEKERTRPLPLSVYLQPAFFSAATAFLNAFASEGRPYVSVNVFETDSAVQYL